LFNLPRESKYYTQVYQSGYRERPDYWFDRTGDIRLEAGDVGPRAGRSAETA